MKPGGETHSFCKNTTCSTPPLRGRLVPDALLRHKTVANQEVNIPRRRFSDFLSLGRVDLDDRHFHFSDEYREPYVNCGLHHIEEMDVSYIAYFHKY
ncbi:hypothetical protein HPP92_017942 [Vanilla planifolia]|uniref:Uncharacterized protein n=1 Tax=Vanilla planifolia TaxID=51239 RepID=A0A835QFE5_VANPL|nr:hypothetical protein HPP92_018520 [Vanilla planifolia]KAG0468614.1 hypothetical protein HPP92_017942 [Vanilla planifolia]